MSGSHKRGGFVTKADYKATFIESVNQ